MHVSRRSWELLAVAALLSVGAVPAAIVWLRPAPAPKPDYSLVAPDIDKRIKETQVDVLAKESPEQSLRNLSDAMMFLWPGGPDVEGGAVHLPLSPGVGEDDIHAILSNRRFLKAMQEMSTLAPGTAAGKVNASLDVASAEYRKLYEHQMKRTAHVLRPDARPLAMSVVLANLDGTPTASGVRYQVLTLVFIAGNLRLKGSAAKVREVAEAGLAQYRDLCQGDRYNTYAAQETIKNLTLYNRQILVTALLGTSDIKPPPALPFVTKTLPHYDVQATPYDLHGRIGVVPVDMSRGEIQVSYPESVSDEQFDEILKLTGE